MQPVCYWVLPMLSGMSVNGVMGWTPPDGIDVHNGGF